MLYIVLDTLVSEIGCLTPHATIFQLYLCQTLNLGMQTYFHLHTNIVHATVYNSHTALSAPVIPA